METIAKIKILGSRRFELEFKGYNAEDIMIMAAAIGVGPEEAAAAAAAAEEAT